MQTIITRQTAVEADRILDIIGGLKKGITLGLSVTPRPVPASVQPQGQEPPPTQWVLTEQLLVEVAQLDDAPAKIKEGELIALNITMRPVNVMQPQSQGQIFMPVPQQSVTATVPGKPKKK